MDKYQLISSERMKGLLNGTYLDRVPFISLATMYAGHLAGLSSEGFFLDPQASFDAQVLCSQLHTCDGSPSFDLPGWTGWDFGGELLFSSAGKIEIPKFKKKAVESIYDAETLDMPDLKKCTGFQKRLEFQRISRKNGLSASIPAGSPLEVVAHIVDTSKLMRWFYKKPELVHRLLRLATNYILSIADCYITEFGAQNCSAFSCYPLESNTVVSPRIFKEFSFPYIFEIHKKLKQKGIKSFGIHLCGDHRLNLEYFKEISLPEKSIISVSEKMDIEHTAKMFGNNYIIGGNIPTNLLICGTQREVFNASKNIVQKMKYHAGGFILMPSCDLPVQTPPLNLYAALKAVTDFGSYA